jgi:hypothetical protein
MCDAAVADAKTPRGLAARRFASILLREQNQLAARRLILLSASAFSFLSVAFSAGFGSAFTRCWSA